MSFLVVLDPATVVAFACAVVKGSTVNCLKGRDSTEGISSILGRILYWFFDSGKGAQVEVGKWCIGQILTVFKVT